MRTSKEILDDAARSTSVVEQDKLRLEVLLGIRELLFCMHGALHNAASEAGESFEHNGEPPTV